MSGRTWLAISGGAAIIDGRARPCDIAISAGRIAGFDSSDGAECSQRLDATGCTVLPGFIDLQINGAIGVDLTTEPERIDEVAAFLPQCGVTSFMPTVVTSSETTTERAIDVLGGWTADATPRPARSLGVHLEGPFLNPLRAGAHTVALLRPPSLDRARRWTRERGVAMVTLAPELPGAIDVITELVGRGIVVCAGHTTAAPGELGAAVAAGVRGATHLFNAMGSMSARQPGPAGAVLDNDAVVAGLIVDGLHVDETMVRVAWRVLGPGRIALVTDAIAALGMEHGRFVIGGMPVTVGIDGVRTSSGVLAGSVLRFDVAVRNFMSITGCTLAEASACAATTPARLAGCDDIGRLDIGCRADVVLLDDDLAVVATMVDGVVVFDPQGRWSAWKS